MKPNATKPRPAKLQLQTFIAVFLGGILVVGLTAAIAWFGPDPENVVRASSLEVPDFSHLFKEEAIAELKKIVLDKPLEDLISSIELSGDGNLQFNWESAQSGFQSSRAIPLAQLDQFLYAEHAVKGDRTWRIHIYCANYQKCITGSDSRTVGNFTLNADDILYMPPNGDVYKALGLLNRLFELHSAQSTIDISKNTIQISEEYWRQSAADEK